MPQLDVDVDRVKAKAQGVALTDLFDTLQVYLGSAYVNDFNLFGRTWRVMRRPTATSASTVEDIANLKTRNAQRRDGADRLDGEDQPDLRPRSGIALQRLSGRRLHRRSRSRALVLGAGDGSDRGIAGAVLPNGMSFEWTDLSFQQATQGNAALLVFPVAILLAFLVLAALYESWVLPLAVILIVPMCMLSALAA